MLRRFIRALYSATRLVFIWLIDSLIQFCICQQNKNKLCVIRLDNIGDFILWTDSAKALRKLYYNYEITLISNKKWCELAAKFNYWDAIWPIDVDYFSRDLKYRFQELKKLRRAGYMIAIQPTLSRQFHLGDAIVRATGAKERIGAKGDTANIRLLPKLVSDSYYTRLIEVNTQSRMELVRNADFVRNLGASGIQAQIPSLPNFDQNILDYGIDGPFFILFPGASWNGRKWPVASFAKTAVKFHKRTGWLCVLCGSSDDKELAGQIINLSEIKSINLAGKTTLMEFADLVRKAKLLIGNETSAVHIAAAVGTPTICILGGGHYGRFMPYEIEQQESHLMPLAAVHHMPCFNCNWKCTQSYEKGGPVPCVSGITVEQVIVLAMQLLKLDAL